MLLPSYFIGCGTSYPESDIVLFGAPYDGTASFRPGSRFAPARMREESWGLETYSPYFDRDLDDYCICDAGDLELPFGDPAAVLDEIGAYARAIIEAGKRPLMLGGEHLVSLPVIEALAKKYPELCIVHMDAHTDLREQYLGQKYSHASVMRLAWERLGDKRIFQMGIRSGTREEFRWAEEHVCMCKHDTHQLEQFIKEIGTRPVYVSIDLDILDPAVLCGTGTPEAGGIFFPEMSQALQKLSALHIVGADVVELAPHYDPSGASTAVACKVTRELMLAMQGE